MFRRLSSLALPSALVLTAAFTTACPGAARPVRPTETPDPAQGATMERTAQSVVAELEDRTRALLRKQDELVWQYWTEGTPVDFSLTAADEKALYTREALAQFVAARDAATDALDARALDQLRLHFVGELLARAAAAETAQVSRLEGALTFRVGGHDYTLRDVERFLARERNALRRQDLYAQAAKAAERMTPALDAREAKQREEALALGYESIRALATDVRRTDLDLLAQHAERVLTQSAPAFRELLDHYAARTLRLPRDRVRLRDLPRMFRAPHIDEHFPKDALLTRSEATLAGLALPTGGRHGRLVIDSREVDGKHGRPLALPVSVPDDVRVSVKPQSGVRVQAGYFHELGHALHASWTLQPRFGLSKLGGGAVSEGWSVLFERLVHDPVWLERRLQLPGDRIARYLSSAAAWDLFLLRRTAAMVLYEHRRHAPGADERAVYRQVLEEAFLLPVEDVDVARHALAREEVFASARVFEAQLLAHALEGQLKSRFGPAWWESAQAGTWLRQLWAHGNALDAREVAAAAGEDAFDPDGLVLRLTLALKAPQLDPEEE